MPGNGLPSTATLNEAMAADPLPESACVTGATGFVGRHLTKRLAAAGVPVRCLVRDPRRAAELDAPGVESVCGDLSDAARLREFMRGQAVVFHLAAQVHARDAASLVETNVRGTERIMKAAAACPVPPRVVYCSSAAAGGPARTGRPRRVDEPAAPISRYGRSKYGGELATRRWAASVSTAMVRPGIVLGPDNQDMELLWTLIRDYRYQIAARFQQPPLSLIHIDDLVSLLLRAAATEERVEPVRDDPRGLFVGCYETCWNYRQLGWAMGQALGVGSPFVMHLPEDTALIVAFVAERLEFPITVDKIREAIAESWAMDPRCTFERLRWRPPQGLAARIRELADAYRSQATYLP